MNRPKAARTASLGLAEDLRAHRRKLDEQGGDLLLRTHLNQAATMIEQLEDMIDFWQANQLANAVVKAAREALSHDEDGYLPFIGPVVVDNKGFTATFTEGRPDGYDWQIVCKRQERSDNRADPMQLERPS